MSDETTPNEEVNTEAPIEPISEPAEATIPSEPEISTVEPEPTAQIPVNEPLEETIQTEAEKAEESAQEVIPEQVEEIKTTEPEQTINKPEPEKEVQETKNEPDPEPEKVEPTPAIAPTRKNSLHELLNKARNAIQSRKRKKLDKVMTLFEKKSPASTKSSVEARKITNDEVEKFLHVSDATATRYLSQLEKEGKIIQTGKTGKAVSYIRI